MDIKYAYYNTSKGYRVLGGTAVHFLKADGSLDGTEYIDKTSFQDITGIKSFNTYLGGDVGNNRLWVRSSDGSNPAMSFTKDGVDNAQLSFSGYEFQFINTNSTGYFPVKANGYTKNGSSDSYVLTGGGGHKAISDFATQNQLNNYIPLTGTGDFTGAIKNPNSSIQFGNDGYYKAFLNLYDTDNPNFPNQELTLGINTEEGFYFYRNNVSLGTYANFNISNSTINFGVEEGGVFTELELSNGGLFGNYKVPTQDGSYIQKKYVDDNISSATSSLPYIPLSGTLPGKPLTDYIHIEPVNTAAGFFSDNGTIQRDVTLTDDNGVILNAYNVSNSTFSSVQTYYAGTRISASNGLLSTKYINVSYEQIDTRGKIIGEDYENPTDELQYIQKKYITDNYLTSTGVSALLANYYTKSETYNKAEVDAKLSAVYRPKGSVANFASLPTTGNTEGDVWNVLDTGANYVWVSNVNNTGTPGWDKLSETVDLTNYVTINTGQTIEAHKTFNGATDNSYTGAAIMVNGNQTLGVYPTIAFHQPGNYAGTLSFRNDGFHFKNLDAAVHTPIIASGFIKDGSDDLHLLLGGGGHRDVNDFITNDSFNNITGKKWFKTDGGNTWDNNSARIQGINNYDAGLTFYRSGIDVGQIIFDGYYFNFTNSDNSGFKEIRSAGFIKNGSDANHVLLGDGGHKPISDFALIDQLVNYHRIDSVGSISNGSSGRTNTSWFDYNWAGISAMSGSVINFSGLYGNYATELFADYQTGNNIGIRTHNGDSANTWNPVKWLWHSGNFTPSNYVTINTPQTIIGDKRFALQPVKSDEGFQNSVYHGGRNRIWSFGNADKWGLSYQQSGFVVNGTQYREGINFHFGDENDFKVHINEVGEIFSRGTIFTDSNGNSLQWSAAYNWGNHAGAGYALANGSNASGEWLNASKALSINPYVPGRTFNASGASYLQDATYGDVNGFLNSNGIAQGNPTDNWYHRIKMLHSNSSGYFTEIGVQMTGGNSMWYKRYENGNDYSWVQVWDKENLSQANINNWNIAYGWGNHANAGYATGTWVNTNFIPKSHPVYNITQANINSWNAAASGSSHTHSNLSYLNNIDQWLGVGQAPRFNSVFLMDTFGYGQLVLGEGNIGGESGLVDISNKRFYAGRINEYLKYGSSIDGFEGLNIHFDEQLLGIGRELGNHEDKVQLAGDLSVDTIDINHNSRQLILNPLYNTDGDVRHSRNAHIYIVTRNAVTLPDKPILGQRIEIFNDSDSDIEVTHSNVGTMFKVPGFCKVTGIAANKGFRFDAEPVYTKQYDI